MGSKQQDTKHKINDRQAFINVEELDIAFKEEKSIFEFDTKSSLKEAKSPVSMKDGIEDLDNQINSMLDKVEGAWACTKCGKRNTNKTKIRMHIESHPCGRCGNTFKSRNSLNVHI